jgi:ADP-ribose pyrophosphatase
MIKKWTVVKEEDVSPSAWMPVLRHTVKLTDDTIVDDYYFSPLGNVAMVMAITTENKIILVRQYKHGLGEILIELPGGMQHHNTTVEQCALAELEEETGIKALPHQLISLGKIAGNPTKTNQVTYGFIVKNAVFNSTQNFDATEDIELLAVSPQELLQMISTANIWVADTVAFIMKAYLTYPEIFEK